MKRPFYFTMIVSAREADALTRIEYIDDADIPHAASVGYIQQRKTAHRGDCLVCERVDDETIRTRGLLELYDCIPSGDVIDLTSIANTKLPKGGFAWMFRNPRPVVEVQQYSYRRQRFTLVNADYVTEYPRHIKIDKKDWKLINERLNEK